LRRFAGDCRFAQRRRFSLRHRATRALPPTAMPEVRCLFRRRRCERGASEVLSNGSSVVRREGRAWLSHAVLVGSGQVVSGLLMALQAGGHRFDPGTLHHKNSRFAGTFGLNGAGADNSGASGASAQCRFVSARCWRRRSSVSRQPSSGRVNEPACHAEFARSSPGRSGKDAAPAAVLPPGPVVPRRGRGRARRDRSLRPAPDGCWCRPRRRARRTSAVARPRARTRAARARIRRIRRARVRRRHPRSRGGQPDRRRSAIRARRNADDAPTGTIREAAVVSLRFTATTRRAVAPRSTSSAIPRQRRRPRPC
jgi:hypothetical protein